MSEEANLEQEPILETKEVSKDWDKEKQRADQAEANLRKVLSEKNDLTARLDSQSAAVKSLQDKIDALAKKEDIDPANLDTAYVDPSVVKILKQYQEQLTGAKSKLTELEQKTLKYEHAEALRSQQTEREAQIEKICKPLDKKFGAKFRSQAIEIAEKRVLEGKVTKPADILEARDILEEIYSELASKSPEKEKPTPSDNGAGGSILITGEVKQGSLSEVSSQLRKKFLKK